MSSEDSSHERLQPRDLVKYAIAGAIGGAVPAAVVGDPHLLLGAPLVGMVVAQLVMAYRIVRGDPIAA